MDLDSEYDVVQKIGEGWFSRVYLTEHRATREEVALKAISAKTVTADEFLREYQHAYRLSAHKNILTVYDVAFQVSRLEVGQTHRKRKSCLSPIQWLIIERWRQS